MDAVLERLADEIREAETVVALTGAGISAPSGVPTFRGDDGVWEHFDEGQFTHGRFQRDPEGFWDDRVALHRELFGEEYEPNVAHEALAELGRDGHLEAICTQNTDGLHLDAAAVVGENGDSSVSDSSADANVPGSETTVLELHGNARRVRCQDCGARTEAGPIYDRAENGELPPTCDCGGIYKPDVVLFGEQLSGAAIQRAQSLARESDVFLAIGSSLIVTPAASLPRTAASSGATVAIVTLEETPLDDVADVCCQQDVTDLLPHLQALVTGESSSTE
ncbi:NAD-dependent protein deacetylase [Natronolimnobius sp. AArcel1]|uniref:SIR2 family NAD-dependent protein deacylase n=1 Tax=Natronolimnobius sp. AArcel1 TaxID=1679093 RepID=UPI0013EC0881|nr:Sir2 family NAD-dependent protein deacetylase [Natronolimnobius sp. AArcel1]NGM67481.1 NAD-dependent protein deacetylase [Natronolimnobius sp. AArcel1]